MKVITPEGRGIQPVDTEVVTLGSVVAGSHATPMLSPERQIHRDRIGAVHQPNSGSNPKKTDDATTGAPGEKPHGNFRGVNQRETDEDDHHWNIAGAAENVSYEDAEEQRQPLGPHNEG